MSRDQNLWVVSLLTLCLALACVSSILAQPATESPPDATVEVAEAPDLEEAIYVGRISGNDVNIRSGPAKVYFPVAQASKGDLVIVHKNMFGWAKIEPTRDCFSYIAKEFVQPRRPLSGGEGSVEPVAAVAAPEVDGDAAATADDPAGQAVTEDLAGAVVESAVGAGLTPGVVTGNNVRVRAGSIRVPPAHADVVQTKLNDGDMVWIIGQRDDYYKIVSPPNCYFWVSENFLERVGPVTDALLREIHGEEPEDVVAGEAAEGSAAVVGAVASGQIDLDQLSPERRAYAVAKRMLEEQMLKPVDQRQFAEIRANLEELVKTAQSSSLKLSAAMILRQVQRGELACDAWNRMVKQDEELRITLAKIDDRIQLLAAINEPAGKRPEDVVVNGSLAASSVFTVKNTNRRFLVLDDQDKIIYYAVSDREGLDLNTLVGKKVSLLGEATYDAFSKTRILRVSSVVEMPPGKLVE